MKILKRWFPNERVKEVISELDKLTPIFEEKPASGLVFSGIKNQVKEFFIKHQDQVLQQSKEVGFNPRAVCLFAIAHHARNDLACGHDHLYRGVLTMIGQGKRAVWHTASRELVRIGAITDEMYRETIQDVDQEIREVG